jgi:microcystin degradation protein MlrC
MRIFVASVATETNTFSPIPTDISSFKESFYALPGEHPDTPTLCSATHIVCRQKIPQLGWELVEGTATWAEPAGLVNRHTYEGLRDEVLQQLRAAMPVDGVILGLHGAMVAQGYDDCEGDLLSKIRQMVGPNVVVSAELDPHSHLTAERVKNADILVAFKEFPHTDFVERAEEVVDLTIRAIRGEIRPVISTFDCRMIEVLPTSIEPMRGFVDKMMRLEKKDGILSISAIHGFMAGDVPEMGTQMIVVTDDQVALGSQLATELGMELFSFRGKTRPHFFSPDEGLREAINSHSKPVVVADVWDNPGGGVAGDSTILLKKLLALGVDNVAIGSIWDPVAVRFCLAAGEGANLTLRFGGKSCNTAGGPVDALVKVKRTVRKAMQSFGDSMVPLGDAVCIELNGIEVILNSNRAQAFSPDLFSNMGIDPLSKKMLVVKSTNHFYGAFSKITETIIYIDCGAPYPSDPKTNKYTKLIRPIWPIVENPHDI